MIPTNKGSEKPYQRDEIENFEFIIQKALKCLKLDFSTITFSDVLIGDRWYLNNKKKSLYVLDNMHMKYSIYTLISRPTVVATSSMGFSFERSSLWSSISSVLKYCVGYFAVIQQSTTLQCPKSAALSKQPWEQ